MSNIGFKNQFVKPHPPLKETFFNKTVLKLEELKLWQGKAVHYPDGSNGYEWNAHEYEPAEKCPYGVPATALTDHRPQIGTRGKRTPPVKKYEKLFDECANSHISNRTLFETARLRHSERPLVQAEISDTEFVYFLGMQKGCEEYNRKITEKIDAETAQLVANNNQYFFLTVTYAYNLHGKHICEAWQIFNQQLKNLFQCLRRTYKIDYVCVLEATKKGYPHAHIILACNQNLNEDFKALKSGEPIKNGDFHAYLSSIMPSPEFMLQKADDRGLHKYLCKYVSQSGTKDIFLPLPHDADKKSAIRKNILSCMMPVLAGVRQFRFSIRNKLDRKGQQLELLDDTNISEEQELEDEMKNLVDAFDLGIVSSEASKALVNLCIKLLSNCKGHAYIMMDREAKTRWKSEIGYYDTPPPQEISDFRRYARPLGCPGCTIYSSLCRLAGLHVPETELFTVPEKKPDDDTAIGARECNTMLAEIAMEK